VCDGGDSGGVVVFVTWRLGDGMEGGAGGVVVVVVWWWSEEVVVVERRGRGERDGRWCHYVMV